MIAQLDDIVRMHICIKLSLIYILEYLIQLDVSNLTRKQFYTLNTIFFFSLPVHVMQSLLAYQTQSFIKMKIII